MILIVGAQASGKRTFARTLGIAAGDIAEAVLDQRRAVCGVHEIVRAGLASGDIARVAEAADTEVSARESYDIDALVESLCAKDVVIVNDVGSGVVPATALDRVYRDQVGRVTVKLAARADAVVRMVCGIPIAIKGALPSEGSFSLRDAADASPDGSFAGGSQAACAARTIDVVMLRHGRTSANLAGAYQGRRLDAPLCEEGERDAYGAGVIARAGTVYVSSMKRARQTAEICFPQARLVVVEGLEEMDFGAFEGRTHDEMADDPAYAHWLSVSGDEACPNGESRGEFCARVAHAFSQALVAAADAGEREFVCVAHGGTIMAAFSSFDEHPREYYDYYVGNAQGYRAKARIAPDGSVSLSDCTPFDTLSFLLESRGASACERAAQGEEPRVP